MAGQTGRFDLRYPTGTDKVVDGDNAIQALAEDVDDRLYRMGAMVIAAGRFSGTTDGSGFVNPIIPARIKDYGLQLQIVVLTYYQNQNDAISLVSQPILWDYAWPLPVGAATFSVRVRREDTHAWFANNPVNFNYLCYADYPTT